jgi:hypothetical protein
VKLQSPARRELGEVATQTSWLKDHEAYACKDVVFDTPQAAGCVRERVQVSVSVGLCDSVFVQKSS